jgi:hypothetical protein
VPRRLYLTPDPHKIHQRGQSLVEFALSSVVLLLLVGGLVDIGRAINLSETLANAAREGARHGAWFDAPHLQRPFLDDADIKAAVDQELVGASLPASVLKSGICPSVADGNGYHNPPYANSAYPPVANQPWLYICYANAAGPPFGGGGQDLNVIVLYTYSPLTPLISGQFGTFHLAANEHITVQGP